MAARSMIRKMADKPTRPSELPPEGQRNLKSQYHEVAYARTWFSSLDRLKIIRISLSSKKRTNHGQFQNSMESPTSHYMGKWEDGQRVSTNCCAPRATDLKY
jgi:hypothetical protein